MATTNVGSVSMDLTLNERNFNKQLSSLTKSTEGAFSSTMKKVGGFIASAFAIQKVASFTKTCIDSASQVQSAFTGLNSIVQGTGNSFSEAQKFINEYTADGLVSINETATAYKNLLSRGYDTSQIEDVLNRLKDSAAFGRQASYDLGEAVVTATEGLKNENSILVDNAGVTKNVAKMWDEYAKSIGTTANNLTQEQKIQAEYNGIMKETQFQVGDAAAYTKTFSGQIQQLKFNFNQMTAAIGKVVAPIAQLFIPIINTALNAITRFFEKLQVVIKAFGLEMPTVVSKTNNAMSGVNESIESTGDTAVSTAKKINKAFARVDEINVLKTSTNDESSSSNSGSSSSQSITSPSLDTTGMEESSDKIVSIVNKIMDVFGKCKDFVTSNWDTIVGVLVAGAATIGTALLGIKFAQFGTNLSNMMASVSSAGGVLSSLGAALGGISAPVLIVIGVIALLAGGFAYLYTTSEGFRNSINQIISSFVTSLTPAIQFLTSTVIPDLQNAFTTYVEIMQPIIDFVKGALTDAWDKILQPALTYLTDTVIPTLTSTFENLWNNVLVPFGTFLGDVLEPVIQILTEAFQILWDNVLLPLSDFLMGVFSKAFEAISEIVNETIIPVVSTLIDLFSWLWKNILEPIVNFLWSNLKPAFETVTKTIGDLLGNLKQIFGGIIDFLTGVFTGNWEKAWNGIKDVFSGVINGIANIFKTPINLIIDGINTFTGAINKIKIPDWVPGVGGLGFSIPKIPKLAQGGWFPKNNPQLAVVGDNTREAEVVTPESKIYDQVRNAINDSGGIGKQEIEITIYHKYEDGKTIIQKINQAQIDAGQVLILS